MKPDLQECAYLVTSNYLIVFQENYKTEDKSRDENKKKFKKIIM